MHIVAGRAVATKICFLAVSFFRTMAIFVIVIVMSATVTVGMV